MNYVRRSGDYHFMQTKIASLSLREKCPNTDFFLVRISLIRTEYGPEKTPYLDTFHAVYVMYSAFLMTSKF